MISVLLALGLLLLLLGAFLAAVFSASSHPRSAGDFDVPRTLLERTR